MMLCPEGYIAALKDASFEELIREKDLLFESIKELETVAYEKDRSNAAWDIHPGPDVRYQMNLEYLSAVCQLIKEKYNDDIVGRGSEEMQKIDEKTEGFVNSIEVIHGSCADQNVDVVVNAANSRLWAGGGISGVIFNKAGMNKLTAACEEYKTPLPDGSAVITPAFNMTNAKAIIHAVGPNFSSTPNAFKALFDAYYNSLKVMRENGYHSISFPLISSGIFAGSVKNIVAESTKQCCRAYTAFTNDYPDYAVEVLLCAFKDEELTEAEAEFNRYYGE